MAEKQDLAGGLRDLSDGELIGSLDEAYRELFNLRMRHATRQLENHQALGRARKQIARIKTIQRERQLGVARG